ncbi:MAG TPA: hypothetical protein VGR10_05125, partial [Thermoleophilaceae bacterium]|nr:hypothetical protein [Thermoleophilaceae bacterium]
LHCRAVEASGIRIHHPNREKPQSKATKTGVIVLLLASAVLAEIVLIGGYAKMAGAEIVGIVWGLLYVLMAFFVARWSRGVLPLAAGMSIVFISFAAISAPAWFARDEPGLEDPLLPAGLLGLLTLVIIAVQALLIVFAMRGFQQEWNVEVEVREGDERYERAEEPPDDHPRA